MIIHIAYYVLLILTSAEANIKLVLIGIPVSAKLSRAVQRSKIYYTPQLRGAPQKGLHFLRSVCFSEVRFVQSLVHDSNSKMPIFGSHSNAATPPKSRLISGPMHARHVGGVSVTGGIGGNVSLSSYFAPTSLEPDELPSHTYVAGGVIEIPRRSNTLANAVRRPSLTLKRSISRLRSRSMSQGHRRSPSDTRPPNMAARSDPMVPHYTQLKPSSISARPNMSLDWVVSSSTDRQKSPEADFAPPPPPKDNSRLNPKVSMYSMSAYSMVSDYEAAPRKETPPLLPVRPKRADSGTAIEFRDLPREERPRGFKEIAAKSSYQDRIALYEKTRDYWANAEHGLAEWTGRTGGPRTLQLRREDLWL